MTVRVMPSQPMPRGDPWNVMIRYLKRGTRGGVPERRWASHPQAEEEGDGRTADSTFHVTVLERLSRVSVSVRWRDVSTCHYGAQTWMLGIAHRAGVCALSAEIIECDDLIYRPRSCRDDLPLNHDRMLLASVVDRELGALD
jgi:hypothetical protein